MFNFLKDNFKLYRRLRGGRWALWNGMWEREFNLMSAPTQPPLMCYRWKRNFQDFTMEAESRFKYNQVLRDDDVQIEAYEDYTK